MDVGLSSTIHSLHVALEWRWVIADHFLIRASLGYPQSVASSSHVTLPSEIASRSDVAPVLARVNQTVDATLDQNYESYVKLPIIGLALGYRF